MRIIPSEISNSTRSLAERSVFTALKAIPDDRSVALHTVHLPRHHKKRVGEIDFVVIMPDILLFIEVKVVGSTSTTESGITVHPAARTAPRRAPLRRPAGVCTSSSGRSAPWSAI
ncbi:nuclease-related domain-containing protein [Streptomyces malaysiensis subsp. malaysiensis]